MEQPVPPLADNVEKEKKESTTTATEVCKDQPVLKKAVSVEGFVCLALVIGFFTLFGIKMGFANTLNTWFNTAFDLLINTCFYLMAIAVVIGALAELLSEFGVISLANKVLSPLMKPLFGMPGATSMAILASFLSDNPAVLTLADSKGFRRYFKKYQLGAITNVGTTYGMGLIVIVSMVTMKSGNALPVLMGVIAVFLTSILVTRLMLFKTKKIYGTEAEAVEDEGETIVYDADRFREIRSGGGLNRFFSAILDGGKSGVKIGLGIIPGVLIIATIVMMLTYGEPTGGYTGSAGEGIALIPAIGEFCSPVLKFLFGFSSPENIAVPLTALGSAGAALGLIGRLSIEFSANDVAVFTAMCMFWSGYLSTHVSMMDSLKMRNLTGWAILFHTIGGIVAGILANVLVCIFL